MVKKVKRHRRLTLYSPNLGFTLIEVLVVMAMVGILIAIAAPSWLGFVDNQRLNSAQSRAFSTLRLAQSNAKRTQTMWQASFRNTPNFAQYAVHPAPPSTMTEAYWNSLPWQNFDEGVRIVDDDEPEPRTTLLRLTAVPNPDVYRVRFASQGNPYIVRDLSRITFAPRSGTHKKCVIISTLLGSMRVAENTGCNQT